MRNHSFFLFWGRGRAAIFKCDVGTGFPLNSSPHQVSWGDSGYRCNPARKSADCFQLQLCGYSYMYYTAQSLYYVQKNYLFECFYRKDAKAQCFLVCSTGYMYYKCATWTSPTSKDAVKLFAKKLNSFNSCIVLPQRRRGAKIEFQ